MKIKLKDLTKEQYKEWENKKCRCENCKNCIFNNVKCDGNSERCWVNHKDLYSNKFLDQEIEVGSILTEKEKAYLENVLRPFKNRRVRVVKTVDSLKKEAYIFIWIENEAITLPIFKYNKMYKGMKDRKEYTLEELGLFERKE